MIAKETKHTQSHTAQQNLNECQKSIFSGMPSLFVGKSSLEFSKEWPFTLQLPLISQIENPDFAISGRKQMSENKKKGKNSVISACSHIHLKPFAKSMCYKCYQKRGRSRKAYNCQHITKANYAKGLCQVCYLVRYYQTSKLQIQKIKIKKIKVQEQDYNSQMFNRLHSRSKNQVERCEVRRK